MSVGYIVAAEADLAAAREIADGFDLDLIGAGAIGDHEAIGAALARAANVGLVLSTAAAEEPSFVALLRTLATTLPTAQLILVTPEIRGAFAFLPEGWPAMSLDQAQQRARALWQQRHPEPAPPPEPQTPPQAPPQDEPAAEAPPPAPEQEEQADEAPASESLEAAAPEEDSAQQDEPVAAAPPAQVAPAPAPEPPAPAPPAREPPEPYAPDLPKSGSAPDGRARGISTSAPADATAFAPKKLRRGTPELVRIVIHQPKDLAAVIKAARKLDPRTDPAPSGMKVGEVPLGASVGVALEVRGATCDGAIQRRTWTGEPIDFNFAAEADADVKQIVFLARVFVNDAQIGVLAFTRGVSGPAKKPHGAGDKIRLKRHKRVFLSYSSKDRETVAAIATAYQSAGVEHFWDRASLKSGEEWSPRLRREIERADLFHLCWSKSAAESEWVEKEAEYALTRRRRAKKPEITVQMLDGPPWTKHPASLDAINFDDFVRAAIVGYARGDSES